MATYFLGIDGGGSKCKVRLENENGSLLSEAISGSANVATSCQQSQDSILHATELAFHEAGLAKFAPLVFSYSDDAFCQQLINEACAYITRYIAYFEKQGIENVTLMGGIASAITPYLTDASKARLTPALASAEQGAILMARAAI